MVWTVVGIIILLSFFVSFIAWSTISVLSHSMDTGSAPTDTSQVEQVMIEVDDPYLIKDGNSIILIKPTPTSGVIFYRAIDPDSDGDWIADRGGMGMVDSNTNELHIFSEFDLSENSILKRENLREYEHTLKY